ncbi:hypothetical protein KHA80_20850 [Anaerobacillus sp. HL2]|nr:hypothetical protein KHA80_20850 [Anaerobacillus sp. HL2]
MKQQEMDAVNVYSRVQMMLFKAKQAANKEYEEALLVKRQKKIQLDEKIQQSIHLSSCRLFSSKCHL